MEFSDLKECLNSFGLEGIDELTKSGTVRDQLKSFQIAEIIKQFLPDGD